MLKRFSDWLIQVSNGWVALAALVIFILFTALVLPRQAARSENDPDVGTPDLSFTYSADDLYRMADAYGEQGREDYVRARFTFDVLWLLVYTFFLTTAISWLYAGNVAAQSPWQRGNLVPILGALFDFLENVSTSLVMIRYPERTAVVDVLAPVFTSLKWIIISISFLWLLGGIVITIWKWVKRIKQPA